MHLIQMNILDQYNHARYSTPSLAQYNMLYPKLIFFKVFLEMLFIWKSMCPESALIIIELVLIFLNNNNNHASKKIEKVFLFFLWIK